MKTARTFLFVLLLALLGCSGNEQIKGVQVILQKPEIRQRYGGEMGALADELKQAGVTHVIVPVMEGGTAYYPSDVLPQRWSLGTELLAFRHALRRRNISFVAQIPVFEDEYTYRSQPTLRAVDEFASRQISENFSAICPSDPAYQSYKLSAIEEVMLILQPDGVFLKNLSFPVETSDLAIEKNITHSRNFCFCSTCLMSFATHSLIDLPKMSSAIELNSWILEYHKNAWTNWKTEIITAFMEKANITIRDINPNCKILLSIPPWKEEDFDLGRQRLAGQDIKTLAPYVDHFVLKTNCNVSHELYDDLQASLISELKSSEQEFIPGIQLQIDSPQSAEKDFQHSLQHYKNRVIVSDWGYMLKNRRYLNIFISEPIL